MACSGDISAVDRVIDQPNGCIYIRLIDLEYHIFSLSKLILDIGVPVLCRVIVVNVCIELKTVDGVALLSVLKVGLTFSLRCDAFRVDVLNFLFYQVVLQVLFSTCFIEIVDNFDILLPSKVVYGRTFFPLFSCHSLKWAVANLLEGHQLLSLSLIRINLSRTLFLYLGSRRPLRPNNLADLDGVGLWALYL